MPWMERTYDPIEPALPTHPRHSASPAPHHADRSSAVEVLILRTSYDERASAHANSVGGDDAKLSRALLDAVRPLTEPAREGGSDAVLAAAFGRAFLALHALAASRGIDLALEGEAALKQPRG